MKTHDLIQGSPEWHAYRAEHWNASDAPAMMGVSPYKTRSQLLHERHTGIGEEITPEKQRIFDAGHAYEAQARPLAELIAGESLYPVVGSEGNLSASFDGITMAEDLVFEHKSLNDELRACLPPNDVPFDGDIVLPAVYRVQMEQQLLISGAGRALFMASKWNGDTLVEERHCWYYPDLDLRAHIVEGWKQFAADLAAYVPPAVVAAPAGRAPDLLPALHIEVTGLVKASNLEAFKASALTTIRSVNRELKTDEDFAHAEKAVKWCEDVEESLAAGKRHALSQTSTIDALFRTIDEISAEARDVRLELQKLVKARKEAIKGEIVAGAVAAFAQHLQAMNCAYLPRIFADFAGVIKNKRTVASLQDAVDTELARVKIEANGHFQQITQSLTALAQHAEYAFLFADTGALVLKAPDDLALVIRTRIADHEAKEVKRLEDERVRIRAEEQAVAQREAAANAQAEAAVQRQAEADSLAKHRPAESVVVAPPVAVAAPTPTMGFVASRPTAANEPATLKLGTICERLGFTVTAAFVAETLGIEHSATDKAAKLYKESDFERICTALMLHVGTARVRFAQRVRSEVAA